MEHVAGSPPPAELAPKAAKPGEIEVIAVPEAAKLTTEEQASEAPAAEAAKPTAETAAPPSPPPEAAPVTGEPTAAAAPLEAVPAPSMESAEPAPAAAAATVTETQPPIAAAPEPTPSATAAQTESPAAEPPKKTFTPDELLKAQVTGAALQQHGEFMERGGDIQFVSAKEVGKLSDALDKAHLRYEEAMGKAGYERDPRGQDRWKPAKGKTHSPKDAEKAGRKHESALQDLARQRRKLQTKRKGAMTRFLKKQTGPTTVDFDNPNIAEWNPPGADPTRPVTPHEPDVVLPLADPKRVLAPSSAQAESGLGHRYGNEPAGRETGGFVSEHVKPYALEITGSPATKVPRKQDPRAQSAFTIVLPKRITDLKTRAGPNSDLKRIAAAKKAIAPGKGPNINEDFVESVKQTHWAIDQDAAERAAAKTSAGPSSATPLSSAPAASIPPSVAPPVPEASPAVNPDAPAGPDSKSAALEPKPLPPPLPATAPPATQPAPEAPPHQEAVPAGSSPATATASPGPPAAAPVAPARTPPAASAPAVPSAAAQSPAPALVLQTSPESFTPGVPAPAPAGPSAAAVEGAGAPVGGAKPTGSQDAAPGEGGAPGPTGPITERVNPSYQSPPATPDDLVSLRNQIIDTLGARADAETFAGIMGQQEAHHAANEKPLEDVKKGNEEAITATKAHADAIEHRNEANTRKQDHEEKAKGKLEQYTDKAGQLATLTVPLKAVAGFTGLASHLPDEPDVVGRFKCGLLKVNADSTRFLKQLDHADLAIADQKTQQATRAEGIKTDLATLDRTKGKADHSAQTFDAAKETTEDFDEKNKQRKEDAHNSKVEAQKTEASLSADAKKKQSQAVSMAAAMQFWANGHRQARLAALESTRKRLEGQGYKVTEVVER
jgi:hypothetical protein